MKRLLKLFLLFLLPISLASCQQAQTSEISTAKISLSATSVALEPEETYKLVATLYDKAGNELKDKLLRYTSSNSTVATVNADGLITGIKKGQSTVTVIADTQIAKCNVLVGGEEETLIDLSFSPDTVTIKLGGSYTPNLVTFPEGITGINYNWYSADESIATVENGNVIAKGVGSTIVKAVYGQIEASLNVTVSESGGSTFTISLNKENISLLVGNSYQLVATTSEEATISWDSENSGIASVDKTGLVTANSKGSTVISAIANGVRASCTVIVSDGEEPEEKNLIIYFYIDYNNVEEPYGYSEGLEWYTGVPIGSNQAPSNPPVAPDPAFPNFMGWSDHTIIDDLSALWDFDNDVIPEGTYTYVLYGIWFD